MNEDDRLLSIVLFVPPFGENVRLEVRRIHSTVTILQARTLVLAFIFSIEYVVRNAISFFIL